MDDKKTVEGVELHTFQAAFLHHVMTGNPQAFVLRGHEPPDMRASLRYFTDLGWMKQKIVDDTPTNRWEATNTGTTYWSASANEISAWLDVPLIEHTTHAEAEENSDEDPYEEEAQEELQISP